MILPEYARSVLVTKQDALDLGFCMTAIRPFCRNNGINFRDFVDNGIEAEVLLATNDQNALDMVEHAMKRSGDYGW